MVESLLAVTLFATSLSHSVSTQPFAEIAARALPKRADPWRSYWYPLAFRQVGDWRRALSYRRIDSLPPDITGERAQGISFEKPSDPLRYDRVQGWSLGFGYRLRVPGIEFAGVQGTIRYGFSDERVTGRLSFLRDAPGPSRATPHG